MLDALLRAPARLEAPLEDPGEAVVLAPFARGAPHVPEQLALELGLRLAHRERELDEELVALGGVRHLAAREPVEERTARHAELGGDALVREPVGDERPDR